MRSRELDDHHVVQRRLAVNRPRQPFDRFLGFHGVFRDVTRRVTTERRQATELAISVLLTKAITPDAAYGGFIGALVVGFQRAAFSNEAGAGSAAIAHSAAKTEYPVREGIVALLEPFIDTVVVCTITALVMVITGAYNNPSTRTSSRGARARRSPRARSASRFLGSRT